MGNFITSVPFGLGNHQSLDWACPGSSNNYQACWMCLMGGKYYL